MTQHPLSLFGLQGSRELAEHVADRLEVALAPHEERSFEDGEHKARPLTDVRSHDVFVLHPCMVTTRRAAMTSYAGCYSSVER